MNLHPWNHCCEQMLWFISVEVAPPTCMAWVPCGSRGPSLHAPHHPDMDNRVHMIFRLFEEGCAIWDHQITATSKFLDNIFCPSGRGWGPQNHVDSTKMS